MCQNSNIPCTCSSGLGLTATTKRNIKPGTEYDQYFNLGSVKNKEKTVKNGDQKDTLAVMEKLVKANQHQTKRIADKLKGNNLINTLSNLWHFLYEHVQYTLDKDGVEQLRTPLRTWSDRAAGVDCDCYSIFISSVLTNLGIPHAFRMTKYSGDWQHVYVVVPKDGKQTSLQAHATYFVVDPVKDQFNAEHPYSLKFDRFMNIPINTLSGMGATTCETKEALVEYEDVAAIERAGMFVTEKVLDDAGVLYSRTTTADGSPAISTTAPDGTAIMLPTVISEAQAQTLMTLAADSSETIPVENAEVLEQGTGLQAGIMTNKWLIGLAVLGLGVVLYNSSTPKALSGLGASKTVKKIKL